MQFKTIEEKLNGLCSQHDYFMTLLTISDSLANIKNSNQSNKNTLTKIASLEQNVGEIYDSYIQLKQKQQQLGQSKLEKFKKNLQQIQQKIQEYSFQLGHIFQGINKAQIQINHSPLIQTINKFNNSANSILDNQMKNINRTIAQYKNDLEDQITDARKIVSMIEQQYQTQKIMIQTQSNKEDSEQNISIQKRLNSILLETMKDELLQYDKLNHQIALYKLQFQPPQFLPFFYHNSQQIRMRIQILLYKISKAKDKLIYKEKIAFLEDEYEELFYRTRALKQYSTDQLLVLYQVKQKKRTVNNLEKQINDGIKLLQNQLQLTSSSLHQLKMGNTHSVETSNLQVYSQL